jgi:hypothetical protein
MPTILQRLFPIPEVRIVLSAYRDEVRRIGNEDKGGVFNSVAGVEMLNEEIVNSIYACKDVAKQKIANGKAPRVLVLLVISNIAYRDIASGKHHVYRGRLSMQGRCLTALWHYTMNELEKAGEISAEDKRLADQNLNEAIRGVG